MSLYDKFSISTPPVAALVKLLHAGDELVPVDAAHDGRQPVHQAHRVLSPRHLHAAHLNNNKLG